ncbi:hypothetical protein V5799_033273 [Amblyomma americanum]|uniref:Anoctamin n=1 Tax=Amblyomma americanum TaxID=6943 RepID=A0AAQ4DNS6_AMBAM
MIPRACFGAKKFLLRTRILKTFVAARCIANRDLRMARVQPEFAAVSSKIIRAGKKQAPEKAANKGQEKSAKKKVDKDKSEPPKSSKDKPGANKPGKDKADKSTLKKGKAVKGQRRKGKQGKEKAVHDTSDNKPEPDEPEEADDQDQLLPTEDKPEGDHETKSEKAKAKEKSKVKQGTAASAKKGQKGVKPDAKRPSEPTALEGEEHEEDTQRKLVLRSECRLECHAMRFLFYGPQETLKKAPKKKPPVKSPKKTDNPGVEGQPEDVPLLPDDQRTLFFEDGLRRIDIVLAYKDHGNPTHERYRRIFQENLEEEGLDIEIVNGEIESDSVEIEVVGKAPSKKKLSRLKSPFPYDKKLIPDENEFYNAEFVRQREAMRYFGEKVGLYFAWIGFYTTMLILPAFVGIFTSLYGLAYMLTNKPTSILAHGAYTLFAQLCVVICTVLGMIGYRIVMVTFLSSKFSRPVAHIGTSASVSMFNLAIILGMNKREYEYSFAFKMFLFTFLNNNFTFIYIAFFKCRIFQALWRQRRWRQGKELLHEQRSALARWEEDYLLEECPKLAPFDEYLDMTIQFGFVTLFVAAFALAPLFALIDNISQIRLDAYRYSKRLRRPVAERAPNTGAKMPSFYRQCCLIQYKSAYVGRF